MFVVWCCWCWVLGWLDLVLMNCFKLLDVVFCVTVLLFTLFVVFL